MGPSVKFVSPSMGLISKTKMGVHFFVRKNYQTGVWQKTILFPNFFLNPSLIAPRCDIHLRRHYSLPDVFLATIYKTDFIFESGDERDYILPLFPAAVGGWRERDGAAVVTAVI